MKTIEFGYIKYEIGVVRLSMGFIFFVYVKVGCIIFELPTTFSQALHLGSSTASNKQPLPNAHLND